MSSGVHNDTYVDDFDTKGILAKTIFEERLKIFNIFKDTFSFDENTTVLDVGVSADSNYTFSNYFEEYYPHKEKITALGLFDCSFLEEKYPGLKFIFGDGTKLPLEDNTIDIVFSSATIEHVGSFEQQKKFVLEAIRIAKKGVFITTPNRLFPIDFHTALPLLHYFPKKIHRTILRILGKKELAKEENLNLMTVRDFKKIMANNTISYSFKYNYFLGLGANILYIAKK